MYYPLATQNGGSTIIFITADTTHSPAASTCTSMWCDAMMWLGAYWWLGKSLIHYMLVLGAPHCHHHFACLYTLLLASQHFQSRYGWQKSLRNKRNFMISSFYCLWELQKLKSGTQVNGIRCNFLYEMYIYKLDPIISSYICGCFDGPSCCFCTCHSWNQDNAPLSPQHAHQHAPYHVVDLHTIETP